jgi:hypothetical protein
VSSVNYSDFFEGKWIAVVRTSSNALAFEPTYQTRENGPVFVYWDGALKPTQTVPGFERLELRNRKRAFDTSTLETVELESLSR